MRALPPPANSERISPKEMPTRPDLFKAWADYACVEWPAELMIRSYNAWSGETHWCLCLPGAIEEFRHVYREWWLLTEDQKEALMHLCQRESPRRQYYRQEARKAAGMRRPSADGLGRDGRASDRDKEGVGPE